MAELFAPYSLAVEVAPERRVFGIWTQGPFSAVGKNFEELNAIVKKAGLEDDGTKVTKVMAVFTSPMSVPEKDLVHLCGIMAPEGVACPDGLQEVQLPAGQFACGVVCGPYGGLRKAWGHLCSAWVKEQNLELKELSEQSPSFEIYVEGCDGSNTAEMLRTKLYRPVAGSRKRARPEADAAESDGKVPGRLCPYLVSQAALKQVAWYEKVFGATRKAMHFADPEKTQVMHCELAFPEGSIMLSDGFGKNEPATPAGFHVQFSCSEPDAVQRYWDAAMANDAEIKMDLAVQFWDDFFGQFKDPFGVEWAFNAPTTAEDRKRLKVATKPEFLLVDQEKTA
jgi:uncharacterized glyoxalase superfamily protein PhnB/predicted transcriptional regulator YdeE